MRRGWERERRGGTRGDTYGVSPPLIHFVMVHHEHHHVQAHQQRHRDLKSLMKYDVVDLLHDPR